MLLLSAAISGNCAARTAQTAFVATASLRSGSGGVASAADGILEVRRVDKRTQSGAKRCTRNDDR